MSRAVGLLIGVLLLAAGGGYHLYQSGALGHVGNFTGVYSGQILTKGPYYVIDGNVRYVPGVDARLIDGLAVVYGASYIRGVEHKPDFVSVLLTDKLTVVFNGTVSVCHDRVDVGPLMVCRKGGAFYNAYVVVVGKP